MTQEQKELILKDLCARLPYGVKIQSYSYEEDMETIETLHEIDSDGYMSTLECDTLKNILKPYLFPLSSMTEWQNRELEFLMKNSIESCGMLSPYDCLEMERFFNENHIDWRGLIPMGLAIDATGKNIY